jgi:hypothetical protein
VLTIGLTESSRERLVKRVNQPCTSLQVSTTIPETLWHVRRLHFLQRWNDARWFVEEVPAGAA